MEVGWDSCKGLEDGGRGSGKRKIGTENMATREYGWKKSFGIGGDEDDIAGWRWLFDGLEEGILRFSIQLVGVVDDDVFGGVLYGLTREEVFDLTDLIDGPPGCLVNY